MIQPEAGDAGGALGAAYLAHLCLGHVLGRSGLLGDAGELLFESARAEGGNQILRQGLADLIHAAEERGR